MDSKIRLFYFEARGRAEVCRLALALAGKEFEDVRFSREDWPAKYKPESPFGQAPYIEIDGKKYGQSAAIGSYLAKEFNLYGKSNLDALRVDEVINLVGDLLQELVKGFVEKDEAKKAEIEKNLQAEVVPKFFGYFSKLLKENGTGVFVGKDLSMADLYVYDIITSMKKMRGVDFEKVPELKTLKDKVEANSRIKRYIDSRPETQF